MNIITVLKSGGCYNREYVENLRIALEKNVSVPYKFVCLTDTPKEEYDYPLLHNFPSWWSKLEMFDQEQFPGHNVFIDLDTVILKPIDEIVTRPEGLVMMRDFRITRANSCLMSWRRNMSYVLKEFLKNPRQYMYRFKSVPWLGDQAMIEYSTIERAQTIHFWQDILPDQYLVNWTLEPEDKREKAHLAWWTDNPKPHQIQHELIDKYWRHL